MSRSFAPVSPSLWASGKFLSLDSEGRLLMLYFISGPHQNFAGCCRVREGYVLADLGWVSKQYRTSLAAVIAADLILYDAATEEAYVKKWFRHKGNRPTNRDHATGIMRIIEMIDSDQIRELAEADFMETPLALKTFGAVAPANDPEPIPITSALKDTAIVRRGR